jgi:hypothetical protein
MPIVLASSSVGADGERTSRISDEAVTELDLDAMPKRPKLFIEWGPDFLGNGNIPRGIELPTGAIWQPTLIVFGTYRTALQAFHRDDETASEWANQMDLFANLQLSGSERFLLGIRPMQEDGRFTSYQFGPDNGFDDDTGWNDETNVEITTFFFEGDFGEIFPNLDREDRKHLDIGFSVGRQPLNYQAGMLINDSIDALGVTRNTLLPKGTSDLQLTFLFGWNDIHRGDNIEKSNQKLYGFFMAMDRHRTTINVDLVYVDDRNGDDDGFFWGVSDIRRIGHFNLSSRILGSHALEEESLAVGDGYLLFAELSWTPAWTDDNVYINAFLGIDDFTSAARDPSTGGPLGRTGILFQAIGMGRYGAPLGNQATESVGGAIGYQWFINPIKNQFIFEFGARQGTESGGLRSVAGGMRYRHVLGQHTVFQFDLFGTINESRDDDFGARLEFRFEF